MGTCLSKKKGSSSSSLAVTNPVSLTEKTHYESDEGVGKAEIFETKINKKIVQEEEVVKKEVEEEGLVKKEVFVIKHRKSHDRKSNPSPNLQEAEPSGGSGITSSINTCGGEMGSDNNSNNVNGNVVVRTSSCTKEEVDAILIQCGRLSRSNSSGAGKGVMSSGRKYSGSKRSYDFDKNEQDSNNNQDALEGSNGAEFEVRRKGSDCGEEDAATERRQHRQRHRQSGRHSSPSYSQGRRRTPSREREQQNRSGSRERGGGTSSSGRRVSRSPGRRSENNNATNITASNGNNANNTGTTNGARPAKMVSVPATVSSLAMDKSNNGVETQTANGVKRISVKRNVGGEGSRGAASPRSQSPARTLSPARANKNTNENTQQQPSLSRNSSRKAEHSPYRRNPLSEIDPNSLAYPQATGNKSAAINNNNSNTRAQVQKPNVETKGANFKGNTKSSMENKVAREQQQIVEESEGQQQPMNASTAMTNIVTETLKPQKTITRSRSGRRSRDLDINPEVLLNTTPSYTTLLLEDIQNFHQKSNTATATPSFSLPPCVTKACSILEAVADLNSTTSSNLSCAFSDDRRSPPPVAANLVGKKQVNVKDPFVESEVNVNDDLMEPSFHKYVTVRRGGTLCGEIDMDGQESSGSNSFVGGGSQQHRGYSTSSWEPNSADSTDRWTSSNNRDEDKKSPLGIQRHASAEGGRELEEARRGFSGQRTGNGRGRLGGGHSRNVYQNPTVAAAAST